MPIEPRVDGQPVPDDPTTLLDIDERGTAYVLFSITERGRNAYLTDAKIAGLITGARVPIVLTSRSDSDSTKYLSILAAVTIA